LKGVTNFLAGAFRIGVPLIGIGEEKLGPNVFITPKDESRARALDPLVGVKATLLKRGVC
jgi:hypothetical protein